MLSAVELTDLSADRTTWVIVVFGYRTTDGRIDMLPTWYVAATMAPPAPREARLPHSGISQESARTVTIFSKIINREIPADIVYEDEHCLAFRDVNPQAPVHVLLIPRTPVRSLDDLSADRHQQLCAHLLLTVPRVAELLGLTGGYRTVINTGPHGGQTVFHLHIHILGGRDLTWPPG